MTDELTTEEKIEAINVLILSEIGPKLDGFDTGLILSAMAMAMIQIAQVGLKCSQTEAIALVQECFRATTAANLN